MVVLCNVGSKGHKLLLTGISELCCPCETRWVQITNDGQTEPHWITEDTVTHKLEVEQTSSDYTPAYTMTNAAAWAKSQHRTGRIFLESLLLSVGVMCVLNERWNRNTTGTVKVRGARRCLQQRIWCRCVAQALMKGGVHVSGATLLCISVLLQESPMWEKNI